MRGTEHRAPISCQHHSPPKPLDSRQASKAANVAVLRPQSRSGQQGQGGDVAKLTFRISCHLPPHETGRGLEGLRFVSFHFSETCKGVQICPFHCE